MDLFALTTLPTRADEAKGTATYKLLRATGQPPAAVCLNDSYKAQRVTIATAILTIAPDAVKAGLGICLFQAFDTYRHLRLEYTGSCGALTEAKDGHCRRA